MNSRPPRSRRPEASSSFSSQRQYKRKCSTRQYMAPISSSWALLTATSLLMMTQRLPFCQGQQHTTLDSKILGFLDMIPLLQSIASDPFLQDRIGQVTEDLDFVTLSYWWEGFQPETKTDQQVVPAPAPTPRPTQPPTQQPTMIPYALGDAVPFGTPWPFWRRKLWERLFSSGDNGDSSSSADETPRVTPSSTNIQRQEEQEPPPIDEFSQVLIGQQGRTCYVVFEGRYSDGSWADSWTPQPQRLTVPGVHQQGCDNGAEECQCEAHWQIVEDNFPLYSGEIVPYINQCMQECRGNNGNGQIVDGGTCDLVLAGHGQGGAMAQLFGLVFGPVYQPYVFASGTSSVVYTDGCVGFAEDRMFRFVNVQTVSTPIQANGRSYNICFDDVPFVGREFFHDYGTLIGLGPSGFDVADPTSVPQFMTVEHEDMRYPTCREAHDFEHYLQKLMAASAKGTVLGIASIIGFDNGQLCSVDGDCRPGSICQPDSNGFTWICAVEATPPPTLAPVLPPTPFPTSSPTTTSPSSKPPTRFPTREPTRAPTKRPTNAPTNPPTKAPTKQPTKAPTNSPTVRPTPYPTSPPVPYPTFPPTPAPTAAPTPYPTVKPTPSPTDDPTPFPTDVPTPSPTARPLDGRINEDENPDEGPIEGGTDATDSPPTELTEFEEETEPPNEAPAPSDPVIFYGDDPTNDIPSGTEPDGPSSAVDNPTEGITEEPDNDPEVLPVSRTEVFRVSLFLNEVTQVLRGSDILTFERITTGHLKDRIIQYAVELAWDPPILDVNVKTDVVDQKLVSYPQNATDGTTSLNSVASTSRKSQNSGVRRRRAQASEGPTALDIRFDIYVSYETANPENLALESLIVQAFRSERGRQLYANRLRNSNVGAFDSVEEFFLDFRGNDAAAATSGTDQATNSVPYIVWGLIGAAALVVVVGASVFLFIWRRYDDESHGKDDVFDTSSAVDNPKDTGLTHEIVVSSDMDDGISTLGDPAGCGFMSAADEQTASVEQATFQNLVGGTYIENAANRAPASPNRNRLATEESLVNTTTSEFSKVGSGLSMLNESDVFASDNESFDEVFGSQDECFEVFAPPGKLGIVIDLSEHSEPMIQAIKDDSVLVGKVKANDRIISVDGQICTEMSAMQVSKLLAARSANPTRKILFSRQTDRM